MSDTVKEALKLIPKKDLEDFFEDQFLKPLLRNLDASSLAPNDFKMQRQQTITIKNHLLTYRDK